MGVWPLDGTSSACLYLTWAYRTCVKYATMQEQRPNALFILCILSYSSYFKFCLFIVAHAVGIIGQVYRNWSSLSHFKANCNDIKVCRSLSSQQALRNCLTVVPQCHCVLCLHQRRQWTSQSGGHCSTRGWASPLLKAKVYGEWQSAGSSRCLSLSVVTTASSSGWRKRLAGWLEAVI